MRTIGFRSNILFAIAAACGVVASLSEPWYGRTPKLPPGQSMGQLPNQMEDFFSGIGRAFSEHAGITGWVALHTADRVLVGLAITTVLFLLLSMIPVLQRHTQDLARWSAFATFVVVLVKLIDEPGSNRLHEPRYGVLIALGCATVLVACAMTVASAPSRKRAVVKPYVPLPAPPHQSEQSYGPPQF